MVRRNEDLQLKELKKSLSDWWLTEFGREIDSEFIALALENMIKEQKDKFCFKRIGHLSGDDLIAFRDIWNEKEPARKEEAAQVATETRVAGQSEESLPDAGEGVWDRRDKRSKRHPSNGSK